MVNYFPLVGSVISGGADFPNRPRIIFPQVFLHWFQPQIASWYMRDHTHLTCSRSLSVINALSKAVGVVTQQMRSTNWSAVGPCLNLFHPIIILLYCLLLLLFPVEMYFLQHNSFRFVLNSFMRLYKICTRIPRSAQGMGSHEIDVIQWYRSNYW